VIPSQPNPREPAQPQQQPASAGGDVASDTPAAGASPPTQDNANASTVGDADPPGYSRLDDALDLVRFLRANCEWDAAQTPRSLLPYLLEEAHETADAVAAGQDHELAGELGDLLLNVAFQVVLAEERQAFTATDVVHRLHAKMRRRHPHLYGDGPRVDWETLKRREREAYDVATDTTGDMDAARPAEAADEEAAARPAGSQQRQTRSLLHGIASGLEPLSRAQRMQERVATVGFDWPSAQGAFDKVVEEVEEVRELMASADPAALEEEIGDLLFAVVNLARLSGAHAMRALLQANAKFARRFEALEHEAARRGLVLGEATLEELDEVWDHVKRLEY
jgi:MazG family protein